MSAIGHNGGPALDGLAWRTQCWKAARARLLPVLPIEVVRMRVRRAAELGLDYKTYAGVRASTGHDIIAFLFSSNALRVDTGLRVAAPVAEKLKQLHATGRIGLAQNRDAAALLAVNAAILDHSHAAPAPYTAFGKAGRELRAALGTIPGDQVVLIASDAPWEREWLAAGKLGGLIPAERYFAATA